MSSDIITPELQMSVQSLTNSKLLFLDGSNAKTIYCDGFVKAFLTKVLTSLINFLLL